MTVLKTGTEGGVQQAWASFLFGRVRGTAREGTQGVIPFPPYGSTRKKTLLLARSSHGCQRNRAAILLIVC
jgi:hypothetical protein